MNWWDVPCLRSRLIQPSKHPELQAEPPFLKLSRSLRKYGQADLVERFQVVWPRQVIFPTMEPRYPVSRVLDEMKDIKDSPAHKVSTDCQYIQMVIRYSISSKFLVVTWSTIGMSDEILIRTDTLCYSSYQHSPLAPMSIESILKQHVLPFH